MEKINKEPYIIALISLGTALFSKIVLGIFNTEGIAIFFLAQFFLISILQSLMNDGGLIINKLKKFVRENKAIAEYNVQVEKDSKEILKGITVVSSKHSPTKCVKHIKNHKNLAKVSYRRKK